MEERLGIMISDSLTSAGKQKLVIGLEWDICPLADGECEDVKNPDNFEELCSKG